MSDEEEDDYLSEKFLTAASASPNSSKPTTYSQIRKEARKKAQLKNEQNRKKSRRQLELEAREEGLGKSLFERAKEEEAAGISSGNKALSIMMKMGFKPGQSLGNTGYQNDADESHDLEVSTKPPTADAAQAANDQVEKASPSPSSGGVAGRDAHSATIARVKHKTEPLPLQEWTGKQGIGLGKRARSPTAPERLAKMAKMAEDMGHRNFRDRARDEYNNRRAEGRLVPAQLTCTTLDEQMGKSFNILWLNPNNHETFPSGLIEALAIRSNAAPIPERQGDSIQTRLRNQMQADALQPIDDDGDLSEAPKSEINASVAAEDQFPTELLEEATQFLRLQAQDRLHLVLSYLRDKHGYCFWCGVKYESEEEMRDQCPGEGEDDHD